MAAALFHRDCTISLQSRPLSAPPLFIYSVASSPVSTVWFFLKGSRRSAMRTGTMSKAAASVWCDVVHGLRRFLLSMTPSPDIIWPVCFCDLGHAGSELLWWRGIFHPQLFVCCVRPITFTWLNPQQSSYQKAAGQVSVPRWQRLIWGMCGTLSKNCPNHIQCGWPGSTLHSQSETSLCF